MIQIKSEKLILKWQKLIKEKYGGEVSLGEAKEFGEDLCNYFEILLEPDEKIKE